MADDKNKQLFLSLIYSFQMQTMMQLGKLANPMTGKIEKELDGAQVTIDMLDMLKAKSKGNTTDDESRFLEQVIADLKLNYVEERDKDMKEPKIDEDGKNTIDEGGKKPIDEGVKKPIDDSGKKPPTDDGGKKPPTDADNDLPPQE